jgi:rod shape-determining protein MreC
LRSAAFGTGSTAELSLPTVLHEADVQVGDLIVTSGLGDRCPGGYPVALVSSIERLDGQTFARVQATPLAALDRGREVLLIVSLPVVDEVIESTEVDDADLTEEEGAEEPVVESESPETEALSEEPLDEAEAANR